MSAAPQRVLACEGGDITWNGHAGRVVESAAGHDVIACALCGFHHVVPLPDAHAMEQDYAQSYYAETKPTYLKDAADDQAWARLTQDDRLDAIESALGGQGTLIEIGSGPGFFLETAAERGWQAIGIEPSIQAAEFAAGRGLTVHNMPFAQAVQAGLPVADAIVATNVLEHVPDPIGMLELAHHALKPGGVLCLTVPNDFNPLQLVAQHGKGQAPWWVAPPHHLNYFDFDSLEGLVTRLGFRPVRRLTTFPMEAFLLMGDDYVRQPELGRPAHLKRKSFDLSFAAAGLDHVRRRLYAALADAGLGREATILAIKS